MEIRRSRKSKLIVDAIKYLTLPSSLFLLAAYKHVPMWQWSVIQTGGEDSLQVRAPEKTSVQLSEPMSHLWVLLPPLSPACTLILSSPLSSLFLQACDVPLCSAVQRITFPPVSFQSPNCLLGPFSLSTGRPKKASLQWTFNGCWFRSVTWCASSYDNHRAERELIP